MRYATVHSHLIRAYWKRAGEVEQAALEMRYTGNRIGGSNPPASARPSLAKGGQGLKFIRLWRSTALEKRHTGNGIESSNLSLSAKIGNLSFAYYN